LRARGCDIASVEDNVTTEVVERYIVNQEFVPVGSQRTIVKSNIILISRISDGILHFCPFMPVADV